MSLLASCFKQLQLQEKKALIPFITAGDPHPDYTIGLMNELVNAGADIIELGVPFSDPMADGPVIQAADERALGHHVSLRQVLDIVAEFRQQNKSTPVVLMGYLNPIEIMGYERFAELAGKAGVDGVLVVDMPPEEAEEFSAIMKNIDIDVIFLISPTTTLDRIKLINQKASGYLYYVSIKGVTGSNTLDVASVASKLEQIRTVSNLPVGVGFGISDGKTAQAISRVADGVVVGSALVKKIEESPDDYEQFKSKIGNQLREMRSMMDSSSRSVK